MILDHWHALKPNAQACFAASPSEPCRGEHWVVTARLVSMRAEFVSLPPEEQEKIVNAIAAATTTVVEDAKPKLTPAQLIERYIKLRNKAKELNDAHKEQLSKFQEVMVTIENSLMGELDQRKEVNIKCEHGTAFTQIETSVTVSEWADTLNYIQRNKAWELLEARVAKSALLSIHAEIAKQLDDKLITMEEARAKIVPGVKISQIKVLRVRTA